MATCKYCGKSICDCKQVCDSCADKVRKISERTDLTTEQKDLQVRQLTR